MEKNGDNCLATIDRRYWGMVYHILIKYGVTTIFKYYMGDARPQYKIDSYLQWFIPKDCEDYDIIEGFVRNELQGDVREGKMIDFKKEQHYSMGFKLDVLPFSGIDPYLERLDAEEISKEFVKSFLRRLENENNKR